MNEEEISPLYLCILCCHRGGLEIFPFSLIFFPVFRPRLSTHAEVHTLTDWHNGVAADEGSTMHTHTHTLIQRQTHADSHISHPHTHTHKSLFSFLRDRALLQAWPLYHNNLVHRSSLCLLLSLFVSLLARRPPSHSVITLTLPPPHVLMFCIFFSLFLCFFFPLRLSLVVFSWPWHF